MKNSNEKHAAVVLKCLPRSTADRFLAVLDPESCSSVVKLMQSTEVTTQNLLQAILLLEREGLGSSEDNTSQRPAQAISASKPRGKDASSFEFLTDLDPAALLYLFSKEQPRNAATILSTMPKEFGSAILKELEPQKRVEIIRHLASLQEFDATDIVELRFALRLRIQKMLKSGINFETQTESGKVAAASGNEVLSKVNLQELAELSDKQIKKLLKRVDTSHIAPALKVLPIQLQKKVLRNMGKKPARIVAKEIGEIRIDEKHRIQRSSHNFARAIKEVKK